MLKQNLKLDPLVLIRKISLEATNALNGKNMANIFPKLYVKLQNMYFLKIYSQFTLTVNNTFKETVSEILNDHSWKDVDA